MMIAERTTSQIGDLAQRIYDDCLKRQLESSNLGKAVAIHVDTREYAVGETHSLAAKELLKRIPRDGRIVTLTIGPPTEADMRLAARLSSSFKR